jgi:hypothetical protein
VCRVNAVQVGRQFYGRMGRLHDAVTTGKAPSYADWFAGEAGAAAQYTSAQHNGSVATAKVSSSACTALQFGCACVEVYRV